MSARYAIYARYSTDRQSESSIEDQVRRCTEFVRAQGAEVVARYVDEAMSGARFKSRPAVQRMLADASQGRARPFDCLIVDDLTRLSREMLTALTVIFERLKHAGVVFVDRQSGSRSDNPQAFVFFTAVAMAGQIQRESSRSQTHRGLEGMFQKGLSTGGKCLGFATKDGKPTVNEEEAPLVVRIFEMYVKGAGYKAIASTLNTENVPAPYDGVITKHRGRGWSPSTIRFILHNERYVGRWTWNARAFDRRSNGPSEARVPRQRDAKELRVDERPELRIVPPALWDAAQARLHAKKERQGGRAPGEARTPYLAGGLLRCGHCGAHFGVVAQRTKNGRKYRTLGCAANQDRGNAICSNRKTISEKRMSAHLEDALRGLLGDEDFLNKVKSSFMRAATAGLTSAPDNTAALRKELLQLEKARANLMKVIETAEEVDGSMASRYAELGRRLAEVQKALSMTSMDTPSIATPSPAIVDAFVKDLSAVLDEDVATANAALKAGLPGKLTMVAKNEGPDHFYEVTGALEFSGRPSGYSEGQSCGGRI